MATWHSPEHLGSHSLLMTPVTSSHQYTTILAVNLALGTKYSTQNNYAYAVL